MCHLLPSRPCDIPQRLISLGLRFWIALCTIPEPLFLVNGSVINSIAFNLTLSHLWESAPALDFTHRDQEVAPTEIETSSESVVLM